MDFPSWTLWGMALSGLWALAALILAFLTLSPRLASKLGLRRGRAGSNVRTFVGYAFAGLILAFGFFLAGVPIGPARQQPAEATSTPGVAIPTITFTPPSTSLTSELIATPAPQRTANSSLTTGAFAGPNTSSTSETGETTETQGFDGELSPSPSPALPSSTPTSAATATESVTPTATTTPTLTPSPSATPTPTPILGRTAVVTTNGSTLWVRRSPGGQPIVLVGDRDVLILLTGHAHQGGLLWREISTVNGTVGWVQEEFLSVGEE